MDIYIYTHTYAPTHAHIPTYCKYAQEKDMEKIVCLRTEIQIPFGDSGY